MNWFWFLWFCIITTGDLGYIGVLAHPPFPFGLHLNVYNPIGIEAMTCSYPQSNIILIANGWSLQMLTQSASTAHGLFMKVSLLCWFKRLLKCRTPLNVYGIIHPLRSASDKEQGYLHLLRHYVIHVEGFGTDGERGTHIYYGFMFFMWEIMVRSVTR